jgi:hypothetical protein
MKNGKWWVLGLFAIGSAAGVFAVTYWKNPENSVRWSFTQIQTSLVREKKESAARFLAPRVRWKGKDLSAAEFIAAYTQPPDPDVIQTAPCPAQPTHWVVTMKADVFCFIQDKNLWRLHSVGTGACDCATQAR